MKKKVIEARTRLEVDGIDGFFVRYVTRFGNSAKVDCPKDYIGRKVFLVITKENLKD